MNPRAQAVRRRAITAWEKALVEMERMEVSSSVQPKDGWTIVQADARAPNDVVKLDVGPVVFNVPERANSGNPDLYIAVQGCIVFEGDMQADKLKTRTYATKIGYFQLSGGKLEHVYGAHYDMDEERPGHPVFHAQIGPQTELGEAAKARFNLDCEIEPVMGRILGNVRTPSAQMDVFAVMTQICADHLIAATSSSDVRSAFGMLRSASDFFVGAAHRLAYLNTEPAIGCYRSKYWYESPAANA